MHTSASNSRLAYDDMGTGPAVLLLPGAGDLSSEYRLIVDPLVAAGHRVITADLPGHGRSATSSHYGVEATADAVISLLDGLDIGPAAVVGTSFSPAAAIWAAVERPDLIDRLVAISPHLHADRSPRGRLQAAAITVLLRGPWAAAAWAKLYRGWYKASPPDDLALEVSRLRTMLTDPARRRAVRETLTADRDGVDVRIARLGVPTLTVFGDADDHFSDPTAEAATVAAALRGERLVVAGAGHYPHVEQPDIVADAIVAFLERT